MTASIPSMPKLLACSILCLALGQAHAGTVVGVLTDSNGQATPDVVLFATPLDTPLPAAKTTEPAVVAEADYAY